MKAEIISIGTELLLGEITDTNAAYLSSELPALGIDLFYVSQVGDNMDRLYEVFHRGWSRSDILLCTGGLGPTEDDLTRETIAKLTGEKMTIVPELEKDLRAFFSRRNFPMPNNNLKQAMLIPSAKALPNPVGTAPGWFVEKGGKLLIAMPGPPRELRHMWENQVHPRLRERAAGGILVKRTLKVTGISEGAVDELCGELLRSPNPSIGVYAKPDGIHVRLGAKAADEAAAHALIYPVEVKLRERFGQYLWGADEETMPSVVGKLLQERRLTLATMESCTGGLLANTITDIPGSSAYYKGGLVTYATEGKIAHGVDQSVIQAHGVISAETATAMAKAARLSLNADVGIGITGVAGPAEQEGKAVGTVYIGIDHAKKSLTFAGKYPGTRLDIKNRAATNAIFQLRKLLLEL
ncbi:MAG: competence/damage-inducible protein A [Chloroflexi bacterium]|nr:competence/damage-inducible protein A [Chloroflexota bacterium]